MSPEPTRPRVGVPYRTRKEELTANSAKLEKYLQAVRTAGGRTGGNSRSALSSAASGKNCANTRRHCAPGSPADIEPPCFGARDIPKCADPDPDRERTDFALLEHALAEQKPVLAICYGIQSLNVFLGGTLVQDIPSEFRRRFEHDWPSDEQARPETFHPSGSSRARGLQRWQALRRCDVNSSHHQSILEPGRDLRIVSRAPDGVIEAVEWTGDANWVTGVQWHPERMVETDSLAQALFRDLVEAAVRAKSAQCKFESVSELALVVASHDRQSNGSR